jgi:hypothetical protein
MFNYRNNIFNLFSCRNVISSRKPEGLWCQQAALVKCDGIDPLSVERWAEP